MSKIEDALLEATGLRRKRDEPFQKWAGRLVTAAHDLSEDDWDKLDAETQNWVNDASRAVNKDKDIPNFPGDEEEPADEPEAEPEEDAEPEADEPEPEPEDEPEEKPTRTRARRRPEPEPEPEEEPEDKPARTRARRPAAKDEEEPEDKPARRSNRRAAKDEEPEEPAPRGKPAKRAVDREGKTPSATTLMKQWVIKDPAISTDTILQRLADEYDLHPTRMAMSSLRSGFIHSMRVLAKAKKLDEKLAAKL